MKEEEVFTLNKLEGREGDKPVILILESELKKKQKRSYGSSSRECERPISFFPESNKKKDEGDQIKERERVQALCKDTKNQENIAVVTQSLHEWHLKAAGASSFQLPGD